MEREAQKKASQTVKDRDKAALEKQRYVQPYLAVSSCNNDRHLTTRADQAKAKADKQKKAAKQERRG
jgi:hypothetical protein